jgi:N-acetylglutamate synthase-like GNAT family acetyltransferase
MTAMVVTDAGRFLISTDRAKLDVDVIHRFLTRSYWAEGIPRETVARAIENSLCFGVYNDGEQVGFARVISDFATFAYLADVFILEPYRERGLGKELIATVMAHPELQGLRRWSLGTRDAHGLYAQFGFTPLENPSRMMEVADQEVYLRPATDPPRDCSSSRVSNDTEGRG